MTNLQRLIGLVTDRVKLETVTEGDRRNRHTALTKITLSPNTDKGYSAIPFRIIRPSIGRHAGLRLDHEGMRTYDQDTPKFTECRSITLKFNSKTSKSHAYGEDEKLYTEINVPRLYGFHGKLS